MGRARASLSCAQRERRGALQLGDVGVGAAVGPRPRHGLGRMDAMRACMYSRNTAVLPARSSISSKLNLRTAVSR